MYNKNYENLSKEELIKELKSRDEQILMLDQEYKKELIKKENMLKDEKKLHEISIKTMKNQSESQIKGLKETIVMMATASYNAQESFFQTLRDIDKKLNLIIDRGNEDNG